MQEVEHERGEEDERVEGALLEDLEVRQPRVRVELKHKLLVKFAAESDKKLKRRDTPRS